MGKLEGEENKEKRSKEKEWYGGHGSWPREGKEERCFSEKGGW